MAALIPFAAQAASSYIAGQSNAGTQSPNGTGAFAPSTQMNVPGGSPANARNQITIAPVGLNLGSIIQPYIEGAKENGGSGYNYDSPMSAAYMPTPYRSAHVSNTPNGTVIDLAGNPSSPDSPVKGAVVIGGIVLAAITVIVLARRRKG